MSDPAREERIETCRQHLQEATQRIKQAGEHLAGLNDQAAAQAYMEAAADIGNASRALRVRRVD